MSDELTLAREFPTPTREQWRQLVDTVLKGADFDRKLVTTTVDGIAVQPLYTADDVAVADDQSGFPGFAPHTRGDAASPNPHGAWDVRVPMVHPDPAVANRFVLDELYGGASSVVLRFDRAARRGVGPFGADYDLDGAVDGVCVHSADELDRALDGVYLDLAPVALSPGASFVAAAGWLRDVWARRGVGGAEVSGSFGADPLGTLVSEGVLPQGLDAAMADAVTLAAETLASTPNVRAIGLDLGPHVEAGGSPVQQLALLLATGAEMLRAGEAAGVSPADVAAQIEATIVLDADVFAGVATVRAARRVWDAMLSACDVPEDRRGLRLQVRTAARMMTRRDPWVNLLRVTAATFAAGVGGADGVIALPFDVELGFPNELGRRMARNTQLLLIEESHVGRVLDPGGGSYYVEAHTEELASHAWDLFGDIERHGGMSVASVDGTIAERLAESWSTRIVDLARRIEPITGVSEFPFLDEAPVVRDALDVAAIRTAAAGDETHVAQGEATMVDALPVHRSAERIEALRDASDAYLATHGHRPRVFLANLGPVASHTARAMWARNFYEAGGIEASTNEGFATADEAAAAFAASGAPIACVCSSDAVYAELAETTAKALKAAGAVRVELAGNPGDAADAYRTAGVDDFVHVGIDQIEHLRTVQTELGVAE